MKIHIKTLWWFFSLFVHPTSPATYLMSNANWAHFLPLCGRGCVARRRLCMAIRGGTQCQARFKGTNRSECCYGMSLEWGSLDDLSCHAQAHEYVCNVFFLKDSQFWGLISDPKDRKFTSLSWTKCRCQFSSPSERAQNLIEYQDKFFFKFQISQLNLKWV